MRDTKVLNVSVPSLKVFTIIELLSKFTGYGILINCPNLEILRFKNYPTGGYSGDMLGCLKKAYIEEQVCKVEFLSLAGDSMEALWISPCPLPTFENLTHLELAPVYSAGWRMLASLLESSPCLRTLVFPRGFFERDHDGVPFSLPEHVPVCISSHLKLIRINRFFGDDGKYKVVKYFLSNALVLEKIEICPWSNKGSEEEESDSDVESEEEMEVEGGEDEEFESDMERHFEITKKLLTMQQFSEVCQIDLYSHLSIMSLKANRNDYSSHPLKFVSIYSALAVELSYYGCKHFG